MPTCATLPFRLSTNLLRTSFLCSTPRNLFSSSSHSAPKLSKQLRKSILVPLRQNMSSPKKRSAKEVDVDDTGNNNPHKESQKRTRSCSGNDITSSSTSEQRLNIQRSNPTDLPLSSSQATDHHEMVTVKEEEEDQNNAVHTITENALVWFRNDLRLQDNSALYKASMRSRVGAKYLIALFIISEEEWDEHNEAPVKIDFWLRNLVSLKEKLDKFAIPLVVETAKHKTDVVDIIQSVVREMQISHVFWNADIMIDEKKRDKAVKKALQKMNVRVEECDNQCIIDPVDIRTKTGNPYAVFTPFYNTWCKLIETETYYLDLCGEPDANPPEAKELFAEYFKAAIPSSYPHDLDVDEIKCLYPAGEEEAHSRLDTFLRTKAKHYHEGRDIPCQEGTSVMSPYLSAGIISGRQCLVAARAANKNRITTGDEGIKSWIRELGWREFYKNILVSFPRVCMNRAFQPKTENIKWSENKEHFQRWCEGTTGFPIVDAGMRQLNSIGFMHNRLRMITACFLTKDLLIDWHMGERYFMHRLIDGDLASNNGGWQWSASTGTDAQPYFRVFNPLLQSQRFDPKGEYIRKWVPELRNLSDKQIHDPYRLLGSKEFPKLRYPKPIVDHASAKKKYIDEFKRILAFD